MAPAAIELHGNLRIDVLDSLGAQLLGHARLLIEPAPFSGQVERARLEPDPQLRLEPGAHVLRLPTGEVWEVELIAHEAGSMMAVFAGATPTFPTAGGE